MGYLIAGYKCSSTPVKGMVVSKDCIVILHSTLYNYSSSARQYLVKHLDHFKIMARKYRCKSIVIVKPLDIMHYKIIRVIGYG